MNPSHGSLRKGIVVVRSGKLGDFLVAVPALRVIRARHPHAWIVFLNIYPRGPRNLSADRRLVSGQMEQTWVSWFLPSLYDEVITCGMDDLLEVARTTRNGLKNYDIAAVYNLTYKYVSLLGRLKYWALVRVALGCWAPIHDREFTSPVKELGHLNLQASRAMRIALGRSVCDSISTDTDSHALRADELKLIKQGGEVPGLPSEYVVVNPGANGMHRMLPLSTFVEVCRRLHARYKCPQVIVGLKVDQALAAETSRGLRDVGIPMIDLCGRTTTNQLACVLAGSRFYFGNDGGAAHLAAALRVRSVVCMSSIYEPGMWDPMGAWVTCVRHTTKCAGCKSERGCPLGTNECISKITADQIFSALDASQ